MKVIIFVNKNIQMLKITEEQRNKIPKETKKIYHEKMNFINKKDKKIINKRLMVCSLYL